MTIMSINSLPGGRVYRFLGILGLLSCLSSPARPGSRPAAAQTGGVNLRVDVELVTVEVMVLDKKGHPVRNLTRENFQLLEDGKRQEIVTFAEISDDPGSNVPTSLADVDESGLMRGKMVLILFDDSHIAGSRLQLARESAEKYVNEQMRPVDFFAVATYGMSLKVLQNFTHDAAKVAEAIRQPAMSFVNPVQEMPGQASTGTPGARGGTQRVGSMQPGGGMEAGYRVTALFQALKSLNTSIAPVRGKKVVLFYSEDFAADFDAQTVYTAAVDSAKRSNVVFYTIDVRGLNADLTGEMYQPQQDKATDSFRVSAARGLSPLRSILERLASVSLPGPALMASPGIVTMFQQSGSGQSGGGGQTGGGGQPGGGSGGSSPGGGSSSGGTTPGGAGSGTSPGGTGAGTTTPGNTTPGTTTPGNTTPGRTSTNTTNRNDGLDRGDEPDFTQFSRQRMENMLRSLAGETGGVPIFNTSDFNGRLNDLSQGLNNYYVLGFQSNNPRRDGRLRRLEVKTELKGVALRHRESYVDPRPLDVLAGSKGEKSMMSAIASPSPAVQLPVAFRAAYFYESPGLARIPVAAKFRLDTVALKNKSGQLAGNVNIMGVAYGEDGSVAARFSETLQLMIDKGKEAEFRKQSYYYRNYFKLRPGKYRLKLAVADEKGKVGSAEQSIVVPPLVQNDLAGSTLIVAQTLYRLPSLIQDLQAKLLEENDPLIFRGFRVVPSVENILPANKPVGLIFKTYNLSGNVEQRKLMAQVQLTGENGASQTFPPIPLDEHLYSTGGTEGVIGINVPLGNMAPGKYRLVVTTTEGVSNRSFSLQTELELQ